MSNWLEPAWARAAIATARPASGTAVSLPAAVGTVPLVAVAFAANMPRFGATVVLAEAAGAPAMPALLSEAVAPACTPSRLVAEEASIWVNNVAVAAPGVCSWSSVCCAFAVDVESLLVVASNAADVEPSVAPESDADPESVVDDEAVRSALAS